MDALPPFFRILKFHGTMGDPRRKKSSIGESGNPLRKKNHLRKKGNILVGLKQRLQWVPNWRPGGGSKLAIDHLPYASLAEGQGGGSTEAVTGDRQIWGEYSKTMYCDVGCH